MIDLHNVKRISDGELMLSVDVSLAVAIHWCKYYNGFIGKPYPNGKGYYHEEFVVVGLDVDLCEYLTLQ